MSSVRYNIITMQNRIEVFEQMLAADPSNTMVMFGLAKEYEKLGEDAKVIGLLERYFSGADDQGNAYGVLARAYVRKGEHEKARTTFEKGIKAALAHGHPSMAEEYQMAIEDDLGG